MDKMIVESEAGSLKNRKEDTVAEWERCSPKSFAVQEIQVLLPLGDWTHGPGLVECLPHPWSLLPSACALHGTDAISFVGWGGCVASKWLVVTEERQTSLTCFQDCTKRNRVIKNNSGGLNAEKPNFLKSSIVTILIQSYFWSE